MSQENLETLRSIYAAWERGDFGSIEWAHPEIELVNDDGPAPGTCWTASAFSSSCSIAGAAGGAEWK